MKKAGFFVLLACVLLWLGIPSIQEALRINNGTVCRENLTYIENGKRRYLEAFTTQKDGKIIYPRNPGRYMDIIPYMPLKNIPECPCGKPYLNVLDLSAVTACQVNGQKAFEPSTPSAPLTQNGFHDLATPVPALGWWKVPLRMLKLEPETPKTPFGN